MRIKSGIHITFQAGKFVGKGGDIIEHRSGDKYLIQLDHYGDRRKLVAPRSMFLTTNELIGPLLRKVRLYCPLPMTKNKDVKPALNVDVTRKLRVRGSHQKSGKLRKGKLLAKESARKSLR